MRNDPTPFSDADRDDAPDLTQQFWGETRGWISGDQPTVTPRTPAPQRSRRRDVTAPTDVTGSIQAIRDGFAAFRPRTVGRRDETGQIERTRSHGIVRPSLPGAATHSAPAPKRLPHDEATIAQLGSGYFDDEFDEALAEMRSQRTAAHAVTVRDEYASADDGYFDHDQPDDDGYDDRYDIPLTPTDRLADRLGIAAVDPLLMRVGIFVLALALLLPLAWSLRGEDADAGRIETNGPVVGTGSADVAAPMTLPSETYSAAEAHQADPDANADTAEAAGTSAGVQPADSTESAASTAAQVSAAPANESVGDVVQNETAAAAPVVAQPATVDAVAERQALDCSLTYDAATGDSWYRIADAADVTPNELLAANLATVDAVIFPGDEICLPVGATMPTPPTTTPTTAPPATATPTTATPTTTPSTTVAPTTTQAPAPVPTYSKAEVQDLVREIWPDELEEKALAIAYRESGYVATADNGWCCVGVFQIYWTVHRGWLDDYGIATRNDLKDARKNITAAYALYQRAGGWGPWGG